MALKNAKKRPNEGAGAGGPAKFQKKKFNNNKGAMNGGGKPGGKKPFNKPGKPFFKNSASPDKNNFNKQQNKKPFQKPVKDEEPALAEEHVAQLVKKQKVKLEKPAPALKQENLSPEAKFGKKDKKNKNKMQVEEITTEVDSKVEKLNKKKNEKLSQKQQKQVEKIEKRGEQKLEKVLINQSKNLRKITLPIEELKQRIAEISSRPSLTKTAKRKLIIYKKKVAIEEGTFVPKEKKPMPTDKSLMTKNQKKKLAKKLRKQKLLEEAEGKVPAKTEKGAGVLAKTNKAQQKVQVVAKKQKVKPDVETQKLKKFKGTKAPLVQNEESEDEEDDEDDEPLEDEVESEDEDESVDDENESGDDESASDDDEDESIDEEGESEEDSD